MLRFGEAKHASITTNIGTETESGVDREVGREVGRDIITIDMAIAHTPRLAHLAGNGVTVAPK